MQTQSKFKSPKQTVTIIGASGRQLAEIAAQAGIRCLVVDFFGDRDTRQICNLIPHWSEGNQLTNTGFESDSNSSATVFVLVEKNYEALAQSIGAGGRSVLPESFFESADHILVCGGLESRTDVLSKLNFQDKLRNSSEKAISGLLDSNRINGTLNQLGLPNAPLLTRGELRALLRNTELLQCAFLRKDLKTSGGRSVREFTWRQLEDSIDSLPSSDTEVFQRKIEGTPISALFCSHGCKSGFEVETLGVTRQIIGNQLFGAVPFQYCGSLSGFELSAEQRSQVQQIGTAIAREFGLLGVFGIDFIQNEDAVWLIDINPRFTASSEIVQRSELAARSINLVDLHLKAFGIGKALATLGVASEKNGEALVPIKKTNRPLCFGKAILFNPLDRDLIFTESILGQFPMSCDAGRFDDSIADVPMPETLIMPRHPILTLLVTGRDHDEVVSKLEANAKIVSAALDEEGR